MKRIKIAITTIIALVAIITIFSWTTLPPVTSLMGNSQVNTLYERGVSMTNNFTEVNLAYLGQAESVAIFFNTAVAPWYANEVISGQLDVVKVSQNLTAPFTAVSISVSNIQVYANGTNLAFSVNQLSKQTYNGTEFLNYFGTFGSVPSLNSIYLTVTCVVQIVLISGIYHFSGEKKAVTISFGVP